MLTIDKLLAISKEDLPEASKLLSGDDLPLLVELLSEKNDNVRYQALLMLQNRSFHSDDVYPFWDIFREKLKSENSYQRSIGLMLIACNAKWDHNNSLEDTIDEYLDALNDEKPITVRQCIQFLQYIVPCNAQLREIIAARLMSVDFSQIRSSMQKLILIDIITILAAIRKYGTTDDIEHYIAMALTGNILDKKAKKQVEMMMTQKD